MMSILDHVLKNYKIVGQQDLYSYKKKRTLKKSGNKNKGYYFFTIINKKRRCLFFHRVLFMLYYKYEPKYIDHINRNRLDNRIENLRECTAAENLMNREKTKNKNTSSKHKGVSFICVNKKYYYWRARLGRKDLGLFKTEKEAAIAYNKAAKEKYEEFALLNVI